MRRRIAHDAGGPTAGAASSGASAGRVGVEISRRSCRGAAHGWDGLAAPRVVHDFRGYRIPTEAELTTALRTATIVVDANVLLNLYYYNEATRDDLLGVLRKLGDRLWLPHQVVREFWRNRLGVLANRGTGSEQAMTALARQQRATVDAIHQWAKATAVDSRARGALIERVDALYTDLESPYGRIPLPRWASLAARCTNRSCRHSRACSTAG